MNVLVVEDDALARDVTVQVLERAGLEARGVENGVAGFAELQQGRYDAVVCDVRLPFLGGESFFDQLRTDYPDLAGRVVFVTGYADDPAIRDTLEATGQPILSKPFDFDELVRTVRNLGA